MQRHRMVAHDLDPVEVVPVEIRPLPDAAGQYAQRGSDECPPADEVLDHLANGLEFPVAFFDGESLDEPDDVTSTLAIAPSLTPVQTPLLAPALYQPDTPPTCKAAITGRLRSSRSYFRRVISVHILCLVDC